VCDGDVEHVVGLAEADDLLAQCLAGQKLDLRAVVHDPLYVPTSMPVLRLLETFRTSRRRAALVLDEFGGVAGVATVEDIVAGLIGELPDADDATPPAIARQIRRQLADRRRRARSSTSTRCSTSTSLAAPKPASSTRWEAS
jgi:putative hemolysin